MSSELDEARNKAALRARQLQREGSLAGPSVDVALVAESHGVEIEYKDFDDATSGILVRTKKGAVIGVNARHHPNRQRFTIAHELGHYFLHADRGGVFVDESLVQFRSERVSDEGLRITESAANAFAAELLMPRAQLKRDVRDQPVGRTDERAISWLATRYGVSQQAMVIRLTTLELVHY